MKIVVLDGYTLNPGDLNWNGFNEIGDTVVFDHTNPDEIKGRAEGANILVVNKTPLTRDVISELPNLQYIGILSTGYDNIDVESAEQRNIAVCNIPSYGSESVAQATFALLLELCHHVQKHSDLVKDGAWSNTKHFCFWNYPLIELAGKNLGVIGFGRIGQNVANIAEAFGMNIIAFDQFRSNQLRRKRFEWAELDELLAKSDVVTLHCPLSKRSRGMINKSSLALMKRSAFILNTSRGALINDDDLAEALNNEIIAGAALDVLSTEPPPPGNPLLLAKNCIITPHISWATLEARSRLMSIAVSNLKFWLAGDVQNCVY